jgi:homoserine O-acetyltransferase
MGITKIDTIFGCSLGGLQALEMFLTYPKLARKFIVGAAAPLTMPVKLFNLAQLRMLPATFNADLHDTQLLERMAFARYFFRLSCTTPEAIAEFSTNGEDVGDYYLMESTEFQTRFNPYSYALLLGAITNYQLGSQAVRSVNNDFDDAELHLIGIQGDLFTPVDSMKVIFRDLHQLGYKVHYQEFSTIYGHEAWIVDGEKFYDQIKTIL